MKGLVISYTQYENSQCDWDQLGACKATDFIFIPEAYSASATNNTNYAIAEATGIQNLLNKRQSGTTNIWIGTLGITSQNFTLRPSATNLETYIKKVYDLLPNNAKNKVAGVYLNQEALYGDMDFSNVINGSQEANLQVKRMSDLRTWIKNGNVGGTGYLWIPYYGYGDDAGMIIKKIGYVADAVNIFDYCILQPHYMFSSTQDTTTILNLNGIQHSHDKNQVCYRNGIVVVMNKASSTEIGFEMEFSKYGAIDGGGSLNTNLALARYEEYLDAFSAYKSYPSAFYVGGYFTSDMIQYVNQFYS